VYLIHYLLQTPLKGLQGALASTTEARVDTTLATTMSLLLHDIISNDKRHWRIHLSGAREIIAYRHRNGYLSLQGSEILTFLVKWFTYLNVIAGTTSRNINEFNDYPASVPLYEDHDDGDNTESWDSPKFDILRGLRSQVLPVFRRISKLAQQRRVLSLNNIHPERDENFFTAIESLESELDYAETEISWINRLNSAPAITYLSACNTAYYSAARLYIQRNLRDLTSTECCKTVEQVFRAIQIVPVGEHLELSLLFPLFLAAVEAKGNLRNYALYRMNILEDKTMGPAHCGKKVMLQTWERRDIDENIRWEDVMEEMGLDVCPVY
jgi:hypothetical protein